METIIKKHLERHIERELNYTQEDVDYKMSVNSKEEDEGYYSWVPIDSNVTDQEINVLETQLGFKLPKSFTNFIQFKFFYHLRIAECTFTPNTPENWNNNILEIVFDGYPREFLFDEGRVPFANWCDWGLLCFDTTKECLNNEYPIVIWDHERPEEFKDGYSHFNKMLEELDILDN